jgi:phosphoglucosamine mutase
MADVSVVEAIAREQTALLGRGRVLVRASGTEPLIRIMVEAPDVRETDTACERLADVVSLVLDTR